MSFYVLATLCSLFGLGVTWAAWQIWHHTTPVFDEVRPSWPYGERWWFAGPRMSAPLCVFILLLCAGGIAMQVGIDTHHDVLLFVGFLVFCLSGGAIFRTCGNRR